MAIIHILHLCATLGDGGAERQLYLLCRESQSDTIKHSVLVIRPGGRWADSLRSEGITVRCLNRSSLKSLMLPFSIRRVIRALSPDILHCWLPSMNILGAMAASILPGCTVPVVASVRSVDDWKSRLYVWLDRRMAGHWDAVIANSNEGRKHTIKSAGVSAKRVHVILNGLEPAPKPSADQHASLRSAMGVAGDELVVTTVSRLVSEKRLDQFLRVAEQLLDLGGRCKFWIVGDGPLFAELALQIVRKGLQGGIQLLGHRNDVSDLLGASDVFVSCSDREGTSNALLEAMQAGCVPVVTAVGGNPEVLSDSRAGFLVGVEEMPGVLFELDQDRERLSGMGARARARAAAFTASTMAEATVSVYREIANR